MRYDALKKSVVLAYLLWWFLGFFGAHRFYVGQTGSAVVMLVIMLLSLLTMVIFIGFLGLVVLFVWWVVDAFTLHGIVTTHNLDLANRLSLRMAA